MYRSLQNVTLSVSIVLIHLGMAFAHRSLGQEVIGLLQLNYRDAKPIYEQIKEGIRYLLLSNAIAADEKLPSVRELASNLAINPNTIQRAYRELETEGYVYSKQGKGTFASATSFIHKTREQELLTVFDDVVTELFVLDVPKEKLEQRMGNLEQGRREIDG